MSNVLGHLMELSPAEFEEFVASMWGRNNYRTRRTQQSADGGVDVFATKTFPYERRLAIQAKRYTPGNLVGVTTVRDCAAVGSRREIDESVVVTTSSFTRQAREEADDYNVKLINGTTLEQLAQVWNCHDILPDSGATESTSTETPSGEFGATVPERIPRSELPGQDDDVVYIRSSRPDGVENILLKYGAWGAIPIRSSPEYIAIYVGQPVGEIKYAGRVSDILPVEDFEKQNEETLEEFDWYEPGKKMVLFSELYEFSNPIPFSGGQGHGMEITNTKVQLGAIREADETRDVIEWTLD